MEYLIPSGTIVLLGIILTYIYRPMKKDVADNRDKIIEHGKDIAVLKQIAKDNKEHFRDIKGNIGKIFNKIDEVNKYLGNNK